MKNLLIKLAMPILCLWCAGFGQQNSEELLQTLNRSQGLTQIVGGTLLETWPNIFSAKSPVYKNDPQRQQIDFELLDLLQSKLSAYDELQGYDYRSNTEAIVTYIDLLGKIRNSNGYTNYLLRDSIERLAVARIAFGVLSDPAKVLDYKKMHGDITSDGLNLSAFYNEMLSEQEALISGASEANKEFDASEFLILCGGNRSKLEREYAFTPSAFTDKELIESPSISKAAYRLLYTDFIARSHLAALIKFIEKGGEITDINMSDVDRFNQLMKNELSEFKNAHMGIRRLNAGHIQMFIRQYGAWENYGKDVLTRLVFVE